MEGYLQNFSSKQLKNSSEKALQRWRRAVAVLGNRKRLFRSLSSRQEAEATRKRNQEKLRVAVLVSRAAREFITGFSEYAVPDEVKAAGFQICADELQSIIDGRNFKKLAFHGGVEGVANKLCTSTSNGLDATEQPLITRRKIYGAYNFTNNEAKSLMRFIWAALHHKTTITILAIFVLVSLSGILAGGWPKGIYNGLAVVVGILLVVFVLKITDGQQSLQFKGLDIGEKTCCVQVTRNGLQQKISIYDLLPGDVVHLAIGDRVPADGLFISGYSVLVGESNLTGESELLAANRGDPFLLSGTIIQDGSCRMLVTTVGMRTQGDKLMNALSEGGQEELWRINILGCFFIFMTFVVLFRGILTKKYGAYHSWNGDEALKMLGDFAAAIAIVIVSIAEALPLAVTMSLHIAMEWMLTTMDPVFPLAPCQTRESAAEVDTTHVKLDVTKCDTLTDGRSSISGPVSDKKNMDKMKEVIARIQVAKGSTNMIILADDFSTIIAGVKWCCSDYIVIVHNLVEFQLNVNVASMIINLCSGCLTGSAPLTAVQLLWVNMLTDALWALALVTLPTQEKLMRNVHTSMEMQLTSNVMWRNVLGRLLSQLAVIWYLKTEGEMLLGVGDLDSELILNILIFNLSVFFQIYNLRSSENTVKIYFFDEIKKNNIFVCVLIFALIFYIMNAEFLSDRMPVILSQWFFCLLLGFLCMRTKLLLWQVIGKVEESVDSSKDLGPNKSAVLFGSAGSSVRVPTGDNETTENSIVRECESLKDETTFADKPILQKWNFKEVNEVTQNIEPRLLDKNTLVKHGDPACKELVAAARNAENDTKEVHKEDVEPALHCEKIWHYRGGIPQLKRVDPHGHSSRQSCCPRGLKDPSRKNRVEPTQMNCCGCCIF